MQNTNEHVNEVVIDKVEVIYEGNSNLTSPIEVNDELYLLSQNGDILKQVDEGEFKLEYHLSGQPSGIAIDKLGKNLFIADISHQSLILKQLDEKGDAQQDIMKEFLNPLIGPNSVVCSPNFSCLYLTDSGPFGETNLENPRGSIYVIDVEEEAIKPLALNCLAYPSGLALSLDEKIIYVCETCKNRVLRFVLSQQGIYYFSVYVQFKGRFGPLAVTVSASEYLYVARFEFATISNFGIISMINNSGKILANIKLLNYPEITGITFSKEQTDVMYVTENSTKPQCIKIYIAQEEKDDEEEEKKNKIQ